MIDLSLIETLTELRIWVVWRYEKRNNDKPAKVPYDPKVTHRNTKFIVEDSSTTIRGYIKPEFSGVAKSDAPNTWANCEEACIALKEGIFNGLGIMLGNGICGIDIDNCINESGELSELSKDVINVMDTYTEKSPSGNGIHILFYGELLEFENLYKKNPHNGIEIYSKDRFFTFTGNHVNESCVEERTNQANTIQLTHMVKNINKDVAKKVVNQSGDFSFISDKEIINIASKAKNGQTFNNLFNGDYSSYHSQSEADLALCKFFAFYTHNDSAKIDSLFRKSGLYREKWERDDYRNNTISKAIEITNEVYDPQHYKTSNDADNWSNLIKRNEKGNIIKSTENLLTMLENDEFLKEKIIFEEFTEQILVLGSLPWNKKSNRRPLEEVDYYFLKIHIESNYQVSYNTSAIIEGVSACAHKHSINEVKNFLTSTKWDGIKRIDTLLIEYLGAIDTPYTRAVIRKILIAAVARIMTPGCKFDEMLIVCGSQGIGKSTFFRILAQNWFSDSLNTFRGKEAAEHLPGAWIIEIGELNAMNKSEITEVKQFLSKVSDIYRPAYARNTCRRLRQCIFVGTTNEDEFLKDTTGNRRFWPVDVRVVEPIKNVFTELAPIVHQIWAESYEYWKSGEELRISEDILKMAFDAQKTHEENNPKEGIIKAFLEKEVPLQWDNIGLKERKDFWEGKNYSSKTIKMTKRTKICAAEIWCECFNGDLVNLKQTESRQINNIINKIEGTEKTKANFGPYGNQRGFKLP